MADLSDGAEATTPSLKVAEFFAGVGLVRMGLEAADFNVVWANDIEAAKKEMYAGHFGENEEHKFELGDIAAVQGADLPADLGLAWASFPCIDLSLAGGRRGLKGTHSSTFWQFIRVLKEHSAHHEPPPVVAVENVVGLATSHAGADLRAAIEALNDLGYYVDVLTLDARRWVPQSRPRLFLVGMRELPKAAEAPDLNLRPAWLDVHFANPKLKMHRAALPPLPALKTTGLTDLVEKLPLSHGMWWNDEQTKKFLAQLSPIQAERLAELKRAKKLSFRTAYRRTREGVPAWEIRRDDVAGCLRTARGGSSKQALVRAGNGEVRVRWMTPREYARLMGADNYSLQGIRDNQAFFGFGDAVCVPAVSWLATNYLRPLIEGTFDLSAPEQELVAAGA